MDLNINNRKILLLCILFLFFVVPTVSGFTVSCAQDGTSFTDARGVHYLCSKVGSSFLWNYTDLTSGKSILCANQILTNEIWNWESLNPESSELNWTNISEALGLTKVSILGKGVNYYDLKDGSFRVVFLNRTDAVLKVGNNTFENIVPEDVNRSKYIAVIRINYTGEIISAQFTVNDPGGNYTFNGNRIDAPAGATLLFSKGFGITLNFPDNTKINSAPKFSNPNGALSLTLQGNNLNLPNGAEINGIVKVTPLGYILQQGNSIYDSMNFTCDATCSEKDQGILIANSNADLSNYNGNFIQQTDNTLEIKSASSNSDGFSVNFLGGNKILNTDSKENLIITVKSGDGIKFTNREGGGLIPGALHEPSPEGKTIMKNGNLNITLSGNDIYMTPPKPLTSDELTANHYQSVAMEIRPAESSDNLLRINAYRQFVMLSGVDSLATVSYNKYGLPVSNLIEDNSLKTIEQLRAKYPNINFEVPIKDCYTNTLNINPCSSDLTDSNIPPYMLYVTDNFFKMYPNSTKLVKNIQYIDWAGAEAVGSNTMVLGMKAIAATTPQGGYLGLLRDQVSPVQTLRHEYEHMQDNNIENEEFDYMRSLNDPSLNIYLDKLAPLNSDIAQLNEKLAATSNVQERSSLDSQISDAKKQHDLILADLLQTYYYEYPDETLFQTYNKIVLGAKGKVGLFNIFNSINFKKSLENIKSSVRNQNFNPDEINSLFAKYGLPQDYSGGALSNNEINALNKLITSPSISSSDVNQIYSVLTLNNALSEPNSIDGLDAATTILQSDRQNPAALTYIKELDNTVRTYTGLPYVYSFHNDGSAFGYNNVAVNFYFELSATFAEESINTIMNRANSANSMISSTYKELTQVAFDSGKMSLSDYKLVMGAGYCKASDCSDTLCTDYKLLCCVNHPNVPHCQGQ